MKEINIYSNPEYDSPNKKNCKSIIRYIFDLKKRFFLKDEWTDVIAFPFHINTHEMIEGEIYISLARAIENAKKYGEPLSKELARLIIHGGLHLLDHRDETKCEKNRMTVLEDKYLQQVEWDNLI